MPRQRYRAEAVIAALRASGGVIAVAARRLKCHRNTVENYVKRYPTVAAACEEARATLLDTAEWQLIAKVDQGEWPAVRFVLTVLGKERGYGPHAEAATVPDDRHEYELAVAKVYGRAEAEDEEAAESEESAV